MSNDHYVSRWQIANWLPPGQQRVTLYNFTTGRFHPKGPRGLYAKQGLNSPVAEDRLNRLIETPLTQRGRALLEPDTALDADVIDEGVRNALWLLWSLQRNRHRVAEEKAAENLLDRSDDKLQARCTQLNQAWKLSRVVMPEALLFLSSSGSFVLSNSSSGVAPFGIPLGNITWAIPVGPQVAFIAHPRAAVVQEIAPDVFLARSIGHVEESVVVPPALLARLSSDEMREAIVDGRRVNLASLRGVSEANRKMKTIAKELHATVFGKMFVHNADAASQDAEGGVPKFRHFYVQQVSTHSYSIEALAIDQTCSYAVATFSTCWSAAYYRSDARFEHARWAHDREVSDSELRTTAERAIRSVRPHGHVLVAHAPGRIALVWSDKMLPHPSSSGFEFTLRAEQKVSEGPAPAWWPTATPIEAQATIRVLDRVHIDHAENDLQLLVQCSVCGVTAGTDGFVAHPELAEIHDGRALMRALEQRLVGHAGRVESADPIEAALATSIIDLLAPRWLDELRQLGCSHVVS